MVKNKNRLLILCAVLFSSQSLPALDGRLSGKIVNKETGQPIPDANVTVVGTQLGAVSRDGGFYFLENLPGGNHRLQVSVIGYAVASKEVSIPGDITVNFELEPRAIEFDPVIVTATLSDHHRSNVTMFADIISKRRMQELNGNTACEIVETLGGVYSNSYDGFAGVNTPSIRGSQSEQVLILMDGIRLNTAQGGGVDLNAIPLAAIERVEVIKGGHSALLGSDAVGGTINLISKSVLYPKGFNYGINTTIGSFGTQIYTINGSQQVGSLALFAGYNRTQSDGDFEYEAPGSDKVEKRVNNDSKTDNLFLKGDIKLDEKNGIQAVYHNVRTKRGVAGNVNVSSWTGLPQTTPKARSEATRNLLKVESSNQLSNRLLLKEQVGFHSYDYHYTDPEGWTPADDRHENRSLSANVQGIYTPNDRLTATCGLSNQKDELTSTKFTDVDTRIMKSVFGQVELKHSLAIAQWTLIPAVRWDDYSDVGSKTSPKLGVMVSIGENTRYALKGNIGKSYRVPTFNDLYWPADEYTAGNPDLVPETGTNFDVGMILSQYENRLFQAEVTYFRNDIEDLIAWQPGTDFIWRPTNVGQANIAGIESGLLFRLPSEVVHASIYFTKMRATDETPGSATKGKRLIYRPENKWDFLFGTKLGPVSANVSYRVVSKSYITEDNSASLDGYQLLGANIGTEVAFSGLRLNLRLQGLNLLDKMIFLSDGYPLPGREFRFTVGVNM